MRATPASGSRRRAGALAVCWHDCAWVPRIVVQVPAAARVHPRTAPVFLPLLPQGGEGVKPRGGHAPLRGRGDYSRSNPLAPALSMNLLGAPASRRLVGNRKPELAGETPALPGTARRFRGSMREISFRGILSPLGRGEGVGGNVKRRPRPSGRRQNGCLWPPGFCILFVLTRLFLNP